jgi:hypothetical protein
LVFLPDPSDILKDLILIIHKLRSAMLHVNDLHKGVMLYALLYKYLNLHSINFRQSKG